MLIGAFAQFNCKRTVETRVTTGAVTKERPNHSPQTTRAKILEGCRPYFLSGL